MRHQRMHTGERPFRCRRCTYAAKQSTHLRGHLAKKHGLDITGSDWMTQHGIVRSKDAAIE